MACGNYNYGTSSPKGNYKIIQGDTFQRTITIRNIGGDKLECIKNVYFTCGRLPQLNRELPVKRDAHDKEMKGYYVLLIPSSETEDLEVCNTTYDITINFGIVGSDEVVKTVRYQYPLEILRKNNPVIINN